MMIKTKEFYHFRTFAGVVFTIISLSIMIIGCDKKNPTENTELETIKDVDGNTYRVVKIGNQWWMAENLKVTHYRNREDIPNVTDNITWGSLITGAYCSNNNDTTYGTTYGRLYNWFAVNDSRNIAPAGWHVPTDAEWQILVDYLGGDSVTGGKMKTTGTIEAGDGLWYSPNTGATNESGFSALPGGWHYWVGGFYLFNYQAIFYSSTEYSSDSTRALYRYLSYDNPEIRRDSDRKRIGISVRCVRD